jgi:hypothetical protein
LAREESPLHEPPHPPRRQNGPVRPREARVREQVEHPHVPADELEELAARGSVRAGLVRGGRGLSGGVRRQRHVEVVQPPLQPAAELHALSPERVALVDKER